MPVDFPNGITPQSLGSGTRDGTKYLRDDGTWQIAASAMTQATETALGGGEIATQAEIDARTDDTRIVTPKKLADSKPPGMFRAYQSVAQTNIADGIDTKVTMTSESVDADGWYDAPNSRYLPTKAGWYFLGFYVRIAVSVDGKRVVPRIYKNGFLDQDLLWMHTGSTASLQTGGSTMVYNSANDEFDFRVNQNFNVVATTVAASASTFCFGWYIGP